jgi:hypothetical protein
MRVDVVAETFPPGPIATFLMENFSAVAPDVNHLIGIRTIGPFISCSMSQFLEFVTVAIQVAAVSSLFATLFATVLFASLLLIGFQYHLY